MFIARVGNNSVIHWVEVFHSLSQVLYITFCKANTEMLQHDKSQIKIIKGPNVSII